MEETRNFISNQKKKQKRMWNDVERMWIIDVKNNVLLELRMEMKICIVRRKYLRIINDLTI